MGVSNAYTGQDDLCTISLVLEQQVLAGIGERATYL